jgi:hypothetical protein
MHFIGFRLSYFINWRSDVFGHCLQAEFVAVLWLLVYSNYRFDFPLSEFKNNG